MEQRPLRLGDIVDDYCPRERRVTNHAVVAIVEDAIRQTRCTTCDAEHIFKGGREPRRRKSADMPSFEVTPGDVSVSTLVVSEAPDPEPTPVRTAGPESAEPPSEAAQVPSSEGWFSHRRLIRAALPKVEGELPPPRPIPEFTMHQRPQGRPGRRFDGPWRGQPDVRQFRGRPVNGGGNPGGDAPDDDEVNGNVAGPMFSGRNNHGGHGSHGGRGGHGGGSGEHGAPGGGSGRRRRGRRRRAR